MYLKTSDLFFREQAPQVYKNKKIDKAFVDGMHTYEQSLVDNVNCLKYLREDGYIILHDCNPQSLESGSPDIPK